MRGARGLTYAGIGLAVAGFVLISFAWGQAASREAVALQVPYLISGGLTGLGLIVLGATTINVGAKVGEAASRARQLSQLTALVREVSNEVGPGHDRLTGESPDPAATQPLAASTAGLERPQ